MADLFGEAALVPRRQCFKVSHPAGRAKNRVQALLAQPQQGYGQAVQRLPARRREGSKVRSSAPGLRAPVCDRRVMRL